MYAVISISFSTLKIKIFFHQSVATCIMRQIYYPASSRLQASCNFQVWFRKGVNSWTTPEQTRGKGCLSGHLSVRKRWRGKRQYCQLTRLADILNDRGTNLTTVQCTPGVRTRESPGCVCLWKGAEAIFWSGRLLIKGVEAVLPDLLIANKGRRRLFSWNSWLLIKGAYCEEFLGWIGDVGS